MNPRPKTKRETRKTKQEQEHQNSDPGVEPKTTKDDRSAFTRFAVRVHPRTKAKLPKKLPKTPLTQNTTKRTGRDLTQNPRPQGRPAVRCVPTSARSSLVVLGSTPGSLFLCSRSCLVSACFSFVLVLGLGFKSRPVCFVVFFCVGRVFDSFFWRLGFCSRVHPNSKPSKCASVVFVGLGFNSWIAV